MAKRFPTFKSDEVVTCFSCGGRCENHRDSGYALLSGARVADCAECGMSTWYDLRPLRFSFSESQLAKACDVIDDAMQRVLGA